jgi:uncharacterized membrane protein YhiD involved in acid resistance
VNELLDLLNSGGAEPGQALFSPLDLVAVMAVSTFCVFILSKSYQATHRGTSYAQSYIHTLFLMGLCTGLVMMVIGSNIARAFSLVGALSIIRFRTAVKDVRDTGYLFFAIIVGMGCGTGFYLLTVLFTLLTSAFMWALFRLDYASKDEREEILKITFRRGTAAPAAIDDYLRSTFKDCRLINSIRNFDDEEETNVYVIRHRGELTREEVTDALSEVDHVTHAALYVSDQQVAL